MTTPTKTQLLDILSALERQLQTRADRSGVSEARYQCERLRHALQHAHSEGARFAAFTLGRLVTAHLSDDAEVVRGFDGLKQALMDAGHRLAH